MARGDLTSPVMPGDLLVVGCSDRDPMLCYLETEAPFAPFRMMGWLQQNAVALVLSVGVPGRDAQWDRWKLVLVSGRLGWLNDQDVACILHAEHLCEVC